MGLDFSHCDAHWSYSGFGRFRVRLAETIGMDLLKMEGFDREHKGLSWKGVKDPIGRLLNHSDCDGDLSPAECRKIAPRLRELIGLMEAGCVSDVFDYDKQNALELVKGMELAVKKGEPLEFI